MPRFDLSFPQRPGADYEPNRDPVRRGAAPHVSCQVLSVAANREYNFVNAEPEAEAIEVHAVRTAPSSTIILSSLCLIFAGRASFEELLLKGTPKTKSSWRVALERLRMRGWQIFPARGSNMSAIIENSGFWQ